MITRWERGAAGLQNRPRSQLRISSLRRQGQPITCFNGPEAPRPRRKSRISPYIPETLTRPSPIGPMLDLALLLRCEVLFLVPPRTP